jgi:hypothetical protein
MEYKRYSSVIAIDLYIKNLDNVNNHMLNSQTASTLVIHILESTPRDTEKLKIYKYHQ